MALHVDSEHLRAFPKHSVEKHWLAGPCGKLPCRYSCRWRLATGLGHQSPGTGLHSGLKFQLHPSSHEGVVPTRERSCCPTGSQKVTLPSSAQGSNGLSECAETWEWKSRGWTEAVVQVSASTELGCSRQVKLWTTGIPGCHCSWRSRFRLGGILQLQVSSRAIPWDSGEPRECKGWGMAQATAGANQHATKTCKRS